MSLKYHKKESSNSECWINTTLMEDKNAIKFGEPQLYGILDFPRYYRQLLFGCDLVEERVASNSSGD